MSKFLLLSLFQKSPAPAPPVVQEPEPRDLEDEPILLNARATSTVSDNDPFASSLQEALNRARSRKRADPRINNLSMKEKFEMFQKL